MSAKGNLEIRHRRSGSRPHSKLKKILKIALKVCGILTMVFGSGFLKTAIEYMPASYLAYLLVYGIGVLIIILGLFQVVAAYTENRCMIFIVNSI